ncbi:hypothetical protein MVES_003102 [Malassezia vespertilionis]|uniref:Uncharacterized protein n=1 Tax=Malassezia vespertilionis TaxID=2020962 RepID=A0A2N1J956_9BASI|nr:hypothetical protein MVES_003102 [Malassezia vespertilionis]
MVREAYIVNITAVAFIGTWVGVSFGEWSFNYNFRYDQARLDTVYRFVINITPWHAQQRIAHVWFLLLHYSTLKFVVSLVIGVGPILVWKLYADPIIKVAFRSLFLMLNAPKEAESVVNPMAQASASGVAKHENSGIRKRRSECEFAKALPAPKGAVMDNSLYMDAARMIVYIGIGYLGTNTSCHLLSYFNVRFF